VSSGWHSAKKFFKKNKKSLPSAFLVDTRQIIFFKKNKKHLPSVLWLAIGKKKIF